MKNMVIKVTFVVLVIATIAVWSLVALANKPAYDYQVKAECTYWSPEECRFTTIGGDDFWWEFNEEAEEGTLDNCNSVNCGSKYCLRMKDGIVETQTDDEIVDYYAISLVEYLTR